MPFNLREMPKDNNSKEDLLELASKENNFPLLKLLLINTDLVWENNNLNNSNNNNSLTNFRFKIKEL